MTRMPESTVVRALRRPVPAAPLPTGVVTFLLADIEGSVRLWESDRGSMTRALARLDLLVEEATERHEGARPVEQGEGDSFVVVFPSAENAVTCAFALQRAMAVEAWPGDIKLRARIAIHTGEAQLRDEGNYIGTTISRCGRLRSLAHGGQTLLSPATYELVADALPDRATLRDLGLQRMRDVPRPLRVYQLVHPELDDAFPPLRSLEVLTRHLPPQLTSFIGRESELHDVEAQLSETRLLTLTGAGGCGKTRLALPRRGAGGRAIPRRDLVRRPVDAVRSGGGGNRRRQGHRAPRRVAPDDRGDDPRSTAHSTRARRSRQLRARGRRVRGAGRRVAPRMPGVDDSRNEPGAAAGRGRNHVARPFHDHPGRRRRRITHYVRRRPSLHRPCDASTAELRREQRQRAGRRIDLPAPRWDPACGRAGRGAACGF